MQVYFTVNEERKLDTQAGVCLIGVLLIQDSPY